MILKALEMCPKLNNCIRMYGSLLQANLYYKEAEKWYYDLNSRVVDISCRSSLCALYYETQEWKKCEFYIHILLDHKMDLLCANFYQAIIFEVWRIHPFLLSLSRFK